MDDHDLLIRIDERVHKSAEHTKHIEVMLEKGEARFKHHDEEIEKIKAWKNKITGAMTLIGVIITGIIAIILKYIPFGGGK